MLTDLLAALNDGVWAYDINTQNYLFISPGVHSILEYTATDFQHNKELVNQIIDPADREMVMAVSPKPGADEWVELSYRVLTKCGKTKWISQKKRHIIDESTGHEVILSVIRSASIGSDRQSVKNAAEEIAWTKNNLEALINNTEDYIWSIDREGKYVYMNSAYRRRITGMVGTMPNEGDDAYIHSGSSNKVRNEWRGYYQRALSGERYITGHQSPDPVTKLITFFEVSFNPIYRKSKNEIIGVGCFARDITERLKTEEALIEQNERLKNIASLSSHELRRPVASMLGLLNIIDKENFSNPENEQIIEHLHTVGNEIDEVIRLIVNKTFIDNKFPL
jgi:PAS domain S-box-containing protein